MSLMTAVIAAAERPSPFTNQSRPHNATVTILALSSSSRQSFAGNQEIYLADLQQKNGEHRFVRLIDQYPGFGLGIRESLLRDRSLFRMRVTREPECDVPGAEIFLAANDAVVFNSAVRQQLEQSASTPVPCYRAIHGTIRLAKK